MQPFSDELLTILVLVALSWAGVTFIAVVIAFIVYICILCSKRRHSSSIYPTETSSTASSIPISNHSPSILSIPVKTPVIPHVRHKKVEQTNHRYDTTSAINEPSYSSQNQKNKYPKQEYINDENDNTTARNEIRTSGQRKQYRSVKPITDVRMIDRHTPYPPDVVAREKFMYNNIRFPMDDKH